MWQFADRLIDALRRGRLVRDGRVVRRAVHSDGHRRPRRRTRIRPLPLPRAALDRTPGRRPQAARVPLRDGSTTTSRIAVVLRATTSSPVWPPRPSRTARPPRPRMPPSSPPISLPAARRPPCACCPSPLRMLGERPDLQESVRADRERIPNFIEETLRLESPLRTQFRMARVATQLGGVDIPAGASLMLIPGACNRDPRVFDHPDEFDIDRPNARQHIAFGHGIHTCAGAPLARAEGRVTINRFLDRTADDLHFGGAPRPAGRPPLRVPADLLPARPRTPQSRVHARRLRSMAGPLTSGRRGAPALRRPQRRHDQLRLRVGRPRRGPAVDRQHDAGHLRRTVAGEPDDGVGHVLRLRLPLQRLHVAQHRPHLVGRDARADVRGVRQLTLMP